ncbi:helix-turn-helix domain-containing protein [Streptomyces sp. NPDC048278]|uniref:sigma-54-dependent Fis family transcriptional regulator n=1 Tax=Streptomyces sp. NPDC048278 TaxID=3155809 RepID=UPI003439DC2A
MPQRLASCALPVVDRVRELLGDAGVAVTLVGAQGRVLEVVGPNDWFRRRLDHLGLSLGARWSEEEAGTNAFGLALLTREPWAVGKGEHFLEKLAELSCGAAPIVHPFTQRTQGAVGLTALDGRDAQTLAATAALAAEAVQHAMEARSSAHERGLLTHYLRNARSTTAPVLAFSSRIELANGAAARMLGAGDRAVLRRQAEAELAERSSGTIDLALADGDSFNAVVHRVDEADLKQGVVVRAAPTGANRWRPTDGDHHAERSGLEASFVGHSKAVTHVRALAGRVTVDLPVVCFSGEAGTGRLLLARLIAARVRPSAPVVVFDADRSAPFAHHEVAERVTEELRTTPNTVILRHVERLPGAVLAALVGQAADIGELRLLLTRTEAPGSGPSDVFVAGTAGLELRIPPLRERPEDVLDLVPHLVHRVRSTMRVAPALPETLVRHDWPGNVTELEGLLRTVAQRSVKAEMSLIDLPSSYLNSGRTLGRMEHIERLAIIRALQENAGNKSRAAESLGIGRATLYRKLRTYRIDLTSQILVTAAGRPDGR